MQPAVACTSWGSVLGPAPGMIQKGAAVTRIMAYQIVVISLISQTF